jgi:uncharacterized protein (TIGR03086 family)
MELNRAFDSTLAILLKVQPGDMDAPTPCASWDTRALINHFVGTTRWWAGLLTGDATGQTGQAGVDYTAGDFVAAYQQSIRIASAAFGAEGVLRSTVRLPFGDFPGAAVLSLAAMEQFTHGWDLARATGQSTDLDAELAADLLGNARLSVTDDYRGPEGTGLFGPARDAPTGAGPADQLAAFLGRSV